MSLLSQQIKRSLSLHRSSLTRLLRCDAALPSEIVEALWNTPDDRLLRHAKRLQEKDRCAVMRCDHPQGRLLLKSLNWGVASRSVRMLLREPVARRCAAVGLFLMDRGIRTPRPRAYLIDRVGPFSHRSYLLTDYVEGVSLFHRLRSAPLSPPSAERLASQFVALWERMRQLSISHNDLKPENLIVDESDQLWLIDLEQVRFHKNPQQLRRRHLQDLERFFHVRSWRNQPEAAEIFREQIAASSLRDWLRTDDASQTQQLLHGYSPEELESRISVAIIADPPECTSDMLSETVTSVKDLADQIVIVASTSSTDRFRVSKEIPHQKVFEAGDAASTPRSGNQSNDQPAHPWVLVLRAGECATPDLVRYLPEQIVSDASSDAYHVAIDECIFGHSTRRFPISETRVFHRDRCHFTLHQGELTVTSDPDRTATCKAGIKRLGAPCVEAYVEALNAESDQVAWERFRVGDTAHLLWGLLRCGTHFGRRYFLDGVFRSGWIGLQVAVLNAMFVWVQEAKLWQLSRKHRSWDRPHSSLAKSGSQAAAEPRLGVQPDVSTSNREAA